MGRLSLEIEDPRVILPFAGEIRRWLAGETPCPVTLDLELTYRCNHNCVWCAYAKYVAPSASELPLELAMRCIEWAHRAGVRSIILSGGGEPLLYSKFEEIVEALEGYGIDYAIFTNGQLLSRFISSFGRHLVYLRVSLDAAKPETHKALHRCPPAAFQQAIDSLQKLAHVRPKTHRCLSFIVTDENAGEIGPLVQIAERIGVHSVLFKKDVHSARYPRNADFQVGANAKVTCVVRESHRRAASSAEISRCLASVLKPVVTPSGHFQLCCALRSAQHRIGNLRDSSLEELYGGSEHRRIWSDVDTSYCPDCRLHQYNELLECCLASPAELGVTVI